MNDNHVRLRRVPGVGYEALVRPRGMSGEPFLLTVRGGDNYQEWMVESDTERFFLTLKQARRYVDTFFEEASEEEKRRAHNAANQLSHFRG